MIRKGDVVRIKPEFRDANEPDIEYIAASDEEKGRVDISPVKWEWRIRPIETIAAAMADQWG